MTRSSIRVMDLLALRTTLFFSREWGRIYVGTGEWTVLGKYFSKVIRVSIIYLVKKVIEIQVYYNNFCG